MIVKIAQREFMETLKTRTFLFSVIFTPLLIVGLFFFTQRINKQKNIAKPDKHIVVYDATGKLHADIEKAFGLDQQRGLPRQIILDQLFFEIMSDDEIEAQKQLLRRHKLDLFVKIEDGVIAGEGQFKIYSYKMKPSDMDVVGHVERRLNQTVVDYRCQNANVSTALLEQLRKWVPGERLQLSARGEDDHVTRKEDRIFQMLIPFCFMYMMFMGIFVIGGQMLTSVIEEKSSRVIEVLLAAVSPMQLMTGKILGLTAIGLTVVFLWGGCALGAAIVAGVPVDLPFSFIVLFILYYIYGFLLLSAVLAGIGSVCNSIKEAQSLMMPISMLFVIPMLCWFNLVQNPNGLLAISLSYFPPLTPMVMVLRLSATGGLPLYEIILSFLLLTLSVPATIWMSAKIFRIGILSHGKRPSIKEMIGYLWG